MCQFDYVVVRLKDLLEEGQWLRVMLTGLCLGRSNSSRFLVLAHGRSLFSCKCHFEAFASLRLPVREIAGYSRGYMQTVRQDLPRGVRHQPSTLVRVLHG